MTFLLEGLLLVSLCGLIVVFEKDLSMWTIVLKTTASLFFVLAGLTGYLKRRENRRFSGIVLAALLCSMAGDVLLALDQDQGLMFILGVASFAAAHVLFSVAFCKASRVQKRDLAATVILFALLFVLLQVGTFDFQGLFPVLLGYAAVISFMTIKALSLWRCRKGREQGVYLLMAGGVLFLISDMVLLFWLFGIDTPKEVQSVNWALYYVAQGCLSYALTAMQGNILER
ncbi:MAG: lysoplasmalogenase [Lachnospiraceae bacterium]|nr:lysoplasmalogenase [Lachnospiraceae bacterium]